MDAEISNFQGCFDGILSNKKRKYLYFVFNNGFNQKYVIDLHSNSLATKQFYISTQKNKIFHSSCVTMGSTINLILSTCLKKFLKYLINFSYFFNVSFIDDLESLHCLYALGYCI